MSDTFTTPAEHDCGSYSCPTCGPELRAAVQRCEAAEYNQVEASRARAEIGMDVVTCVVDQELVASFVLAIRDGKGRFAAHEAAQAMLRSGMTLKDIGTATKMPLRRVVSLFTQTGRAPLQGVLSAEAALRAGAPSYSAVARGTGLTTDQVVTLAENMGVQSLSSKLAADGKGTNRKYTPEQIAQAYALKDSGLSYPQVAKAMGLKDGNAAVSIMRRNARPALVSQGAVETVAA